MQKISYRNPTEIDLLLEIVTEMILFLQFLYDSHRNRIISVTISRNSYRNESISETSSQN